MTIAQPTFGNTLGIIPADLDGGESNTSYLPTQNIDGGCATSEFNEDADGGNA
jgi:hypothetical protein